MTTFNIKCLLIYGLGLQDLQRSNKSCKKNYKIKDGNNFSLNTSYSPRCACTLSRQLSEKGKTLQRVYKIAFISLNISVKRAKTYISSKIGSKGTLHLILKEILLTRNFTTMSKNYNLWMFVSLAGGTIMFLWYEHVLHVKQWNHKNMRIKYLQRYEDFFAVSCQIGD